VKAIASLASDHNVINAALRANHPRSRLLLNIMNLPMALCGGLDTRKNPRATRASTIL